MANNELQDELIREHLKPATPVKFECNDSNGRITSFYGTITEYQNNSLEVVLDDNDQIEQIVVGKETIIIIGFESESLTHYFRTTILECNPGFPSFLTLSAPQKTNVSSLRCFFRCDLTLPFSYLIEGVLEFQGETKNLSAGGLLGLIKYDSTLTVDTPTGIRLKLPNSATPMTLPSQIVRIEKAPKKMQLIAVKFLKISEQQQDDIIKYLFAYEREMKAKKNSL